MMKKYLLLILMFSTSVSAQSILATLNQHQSTLRPAGTVEESRPATGITGTSTSTSATTARCEVNEQQSLPLSYITSLIQRQNGALEITHDPRNGSLAVSAPDFISNCSSMLEWNLRQQTIDGNPTYAVEVKFKQGSDCSSEGCRYRVAKVENGSFKEFQVMTIKPSLQGFESCLERSGVISGGKVQAGAIYSTPIRERFNNVANSGTLLFVSSGPASASARAKYGSFEHVNGCDHFEKIAPETMLLLSRQDEERQRLDAEADELKNCSINEYHKVADFLEKYEGYATELLEVRDRLIMEAAKKSAEAITAGTYTEDDLKVIADFEKYVVEPQVEKAVRLYEESLTLEGNAKREKQTELRQALAGIVALNSKPFYVAANVQKLIADGKFDLAERLNGVKLYLQMHARLGAQENNVVITPQVAMSRYSEAQSTFSQHLVKERENHQVRTGQVTGQSQYWANLAASMRNNSRIRTENYSQEIQAEYARIQQGGYCYRYYRNTQRCVQQSMERIQELQAYLQHYNQIDSERAVEYDAKAQEYAELEAQGRRYIAQQNGEEVPAPAQPTPPTGNLHPTPRSDHTVYNFDYQGGGQQQPGMPQQQGMQQPWYGQQGMPQQQGYQQNPYQMYQSGNQYNYHQQSQLGYQAYGYNQPFGQYGQQQNPWSMPVGQGGNSYGFNWGGSGQQQAGYGSPWGQQQQPQGGYWNQPYQAYNNYNMWGR